jgi:hypothetical protein
MCIPGTRLSARLPSCVHGLLSVPRLKPKAEDEDEDEDDWGKEGSKQEPGKEMLLPVVAMLTRSIALRQTIPRNRGS